MIPGTDLSYTTLHLIINGLMYEMSFIHELKIVPMDKSL